MSRSTISRWLLVLTLGLCQLTSSWAATIQVGFYNAPPLMIQHDRTGVYHDLLEQVSAITGDRFKISYYSIARLQRLFDKGQLDLEPGINPIWRQDAEQPGIYSIPFAQLEQILVFRPGHQIPVSGPEGLTGHQVGTIRGYRYPGFMQSIADGHIERVDVTDEPNLFNLLERGRVNQIFTDRVVQQYWAKKHPHYQRFPTSKTLISLDVMLRLHPSKAPRLAAINQALRQLIERGQVDEIFKRYR